jgi:hypothetical protein
MASLKSVIKPHKLSCAGKVYRIIFYVVDIFFLTAVKKIKLTCSNMEFLGKKGL